MRRTYIHINYVYASTLVSYEINRVTFLLCTFFFWLIVIYINQFLAANALSYSPIRMQEKEEKIHVGTNRKAANVQT